MMDYQHVGVAATFSPTFTGVFAEAKRFASHCGADLEIVHAGAFDIEKAVSRSAWSTSCNSLG